MDEIIVSVVGVNNPMYGRKWTDVQRERSGTRGMHLNLTEEQRKVISDRARIIGKTTGLKAVVCIEDNVMFNSVKEAADTYEVSKSTMCGHLRGNQKSCCGKHFQYVN